MLGSGRALVASNSAVEKLHNGRRKGQKRGQCRTISSEIKRDAMLVDLNLAPAQEDTMPHSLAASREVRFRCLT